MSIDGANWVHPQHDSSKEGGETPGLPESSTERLLLCSLEWEKAVHSCISSLLSAWWGCAGWGSAPRTVSVPSRG